MTRIHAFQQVSLPDMARKMGSRHEHPIDYVVNLIGKGYLSGISVDISITPDGIDVKSTGTIDDKLFEEARSSNPLALLDIIPPTAEFSTVEIESGSKRIRIGRQTGGDGEKIAVEETTGALEGTLLRIDTSKSFSMAEGRLRQLFAGSDIQVTLNSEPLNNTGAHRYEFKTEGIRGSIEYSPNESGGLSFFENGRHIQTFPLIPGVNIRLYEHGLQSTITKSRIMAGGEGKGRYEEILKELPRVLAGMLKSGYAGSLRQKSLVTLAEVIMNAYPADREIAEIYAQINEPPKIVARVAESQKDGMTAQAPEIYNGAIAPQADKAGFVKKMKIPFKEGLAAAALAAILLATQADSVKIVSNSTAAPQYAGQLAQQEGAGQPAFEAASATYMTNDELAAGLMQPKNLSAGDGYARVRTGNKLSIVDGKFRWASTGMDGSFESRVGAELPDELSGLGNNASPKEKVKAVAKYLSGFRYGTISPDDAFGYKNIINALQDKKIAYCETANEYAAALLAAVGVNNIRIAEGYLNGTGHLWLEINDEEEWKVLDFTPSRKTAELKDSLDEIVTNASLTLSAAQAGYTTEGTVYERNESFYTGDMQGTATGISVDYGAWQMPTLAQTGVVVGFGLAGFFLTGAAIDRYEKLKVKRKKSMTSERAKEKELKKVLGVPVFLQAPEETAELQKGVLYIAPDAPGYKNVVADAQITPETALKLVNGVMAAQGLPEKRQLSVYSRIARMWS